MATVRKFEDLDVWRKARELDKLVYAFSNRGEFAKDFELKRQMMKSSGSIMDNIAEGFERSGTREFIQFLAISKGSAGELRSQSYRALDRDYLTKEEFDDVAGRCVEIGRMLQRFMGYLRNSGKKGSKYLRDDQRSPDQP